MELPPGAQEVIGKGGAGLRVVRPWGAGRGSHGLGVCEREDRHPTAKRE